MTLLTKLNECRLETRSGLLIRTKIKPPVAGATEVKEGEQFGLVISVKNNLEAGGGGYLRGDAHFKTLKVRVWGDDHYAILLDGQNGQPVPGNTKVYPLRPMTGETLSEGEWTKRVKVWFEARHGCEGLEHVASVKVTAVFDVERYFRSKLSQSVNFDVVHV